MAFFSLGGLATAGRQLWLQGAHAGVQPAACGVDIYYLLQMLPFDKALVQIFSDSAQCAQVTWSFLGIGMAAWSLLGFIVLMVMIAIQWIRD